MRYLLRKLGHSGTAVLEFALIAPILMALLLGVGDLAPSLMVKFKVGTATQAVADLAAQSATMRQADVTNNFSLGSDVMTPFSGTNLVLRITNVASDGNGNAFIYWSCGQGSMQPYAARANISTTNAPIPSATIISLTQSGINTSYVMVESQYTYRAPTGFILNAPQVTKVVAYTLPRMSTYIGPPYGDPNLTPPQPTSAQSSTTVSLNGVTCNVAQ